MQFELPVIFIKEGTFFKIDEQKGNSVLQDFLISELDLGLRKLFGQLYLYYWLLLLGALKLLWFSVEMTEKSMKNNSDKHEQERRAKQNDDFHVDERCNRMKKPMNGQMRIGR